MTGTVVGIRVGGASVRGPTVSVAVYKLVLYSVVAEYGVYEGVSEVKFCECTMISGTDSPVAANFDRMNSRQ